MVRQLPADALYARVDADLLKQALLNVVLNGVQAMPEGGTLEVVARRNGDREMVIEVRDQGAGIAPEIRDKVFNLYFTTKKSGTGIGLAMTYKVMQLHHGSVDFAPASPRGTVFQLTLPLQEQPAEAAREFATHDSAIV